MSVLVLSETDVRAVLDMESCIAAMEEALAALARGELAMPLRPVFRPPAVETLLGLMPAYRGGAEPLYALKEIVIAPANSGRGLDPHQGAVLLHDGETGVLVPIEQVPDGSGTPLDPDRFTGDLAAAITQVLEDPSRAAAMGEAGRRRAVDHFSWATIAARTVDVYRSVRAG